LAAVADAVGHNSDQVGKIGADAQVLKGKGVIDFERGRECGYRIKAKIGIQKNQSILNLGRSAFLAKGYGTRNDTLAGAIGRHPRWVIAEGADIFERIIFLFFRPIGANVSMGILPAGQPVGLAAKRGRFKVGEIVHISRGVRAIAGAVFPMAAGTTFGIERLAGVHGVLVRVQAPGISNGIPDFPVIQLVLPGRHHILQPTELRRMKEHSWAQFPDCRWVSKHSGRHRQGGRSRAIPHA